MDTVKWGLVGCGDISRKRVAPALTAISRSALVSVSRSRADLAAQFAEEFGAQKWFSDWKEQLRDTEINAVYIATPVKLHAEQAIFAADHGKHVLCEKPMAMTVEECDRMIRAAEQNRVKLGIAYYRRFYPSVMRVKEILKNGEIGKPIVADIKALDWFDRKPDEDRGWLLVKELSGGGPLKDFGCHRLEILLNLFGDAEEVKSMNEALFFNRGVEDTAQIQFRFKSGMYASLTVTHASKISVDTIDIFCTDGSIHIPNLNQGRVLVRTKSGEREENCPLPANFHQPFIEDFVDAILANREPSVGGDMGRDVERIITAVYENSPLK